MSRLRPPSRRSQAVLVGVALAGAVLAGAPDAAAAGKPRLTLLGTAVTEGHGGTQNAVFRVRLRGGSGALVRVRFATVDGSAKAGSDYSARRGTLVFRPGQRLKRVPVPVHGDTVGESDETFFLRLLRPRGAKLVRARAAATIRNDDNNAPVARAGSDQSLHVVDRVRLDGSPSTDADGDALTYSWSFDSRPAGSAAALAGASSATAEFDPDEPGVYVLRLTVSDGRAASADTVAVTAASQVVRFIAVGDTGEGNVAQTQVAAQMKAKCDSAGCDYVVGLGDNIYDNGVTSATDAQFTSKFETPYQNIQLDFWMLLGNHDYGGNGSGNDATKAGYQVAYTQYSTKWKMPARYYRRAHEHVEFFTLDTNPLLFGTYDAHETALDGWIAGSQAYWKITLGHHPYRSNGPHGNAGEYDGVPTSGSRIEDLIERVVCGRAQVYLAGHDHDLQWLQQDADDCPGTELIVSGAGSKLSVLEGTNPTHFESDDAPGFVYVVIRDRSFTAEFIDSSGSSLFTRTVTR